MLDQQEAVTMFAAIAIAVLVGVILLALQFTTKPFDFDAEWKKSQEKKALEK